MASNYPGSLDSFDTIASDKKTSDSVGGRTHRQMHNDLGDAIEAIETELGTDPAGAYSTVKARLDALVAYAAKTSAYTATVADHTLNVTSGTFTLDLPSANTATGQSLRVKNSGTGVVTLDGNSSEAVEGVATFPLGPGSYVEITSTGAGWVLTAGVPDTGWRDVTASLENSWAGGYFLLRRVGRTVEYVVSALSAASASSGVPYTLPSGFRIGAPNALRRSTWYKTDLTLRRVGVDKSAGTITVSSYAAGDTLYGSDTGTTVDSWPTSLPGTAA